jgi:hypothetical protein
VVKCFFSGGFTISGVQNVVNCVVKRGGVVVKAWLKTTPNQTAKNTPTFAYFFDFFATIDGIGTR